MEFAGAVRREQLKILYDNLPLTFFGSGSVAVALVLVLSVSVPLQGLLVWLGLMAVLILIRMYHLHAYRKLELTEGDVQFLSRQTVIYSFTMGLAWAWMPLYYIEPDNILIISNIGLFQVGVVAGALVTQAVYIPSLYAFLLPVCVSSAIAMAFFSGSYNYLALVTVGYAGIAIVFSRKLRDMFLAVIETRFENDDLVTALRAEKRQADEANLAKSQFLASASHDVRQPLHAMSLYVGMLRDDPGNVQVIERLGEALRALEGLYSRVLEISQLDAGAVDVHVESVDLHALVRELIDRNRPVADEAGLSLGHSVPDSLWVLSDAILLARILDNLVANAIRYTDSGGVSIETREENGIVRLSVIDTGVGIAEGDRDKIFNEFFQVGNAERDRSRGMGLGLSIVRRLCDLLEHDLETTSAVGSGSRFSLELPRATSTTAGSAAVNLDFSLRGMSVLVVEDDQEVREAMRMQLEAWSVVTTTSNGTDAEDLRGSFDLIVADYRLQGSLDGLKVIQSVCEQAGQEIPAVVLTGDTAPDRLQQLRDSGYPILHKPVGSDELKQVLLRYAPEAVVEGARAESHSS